MKKSCLMASIVVMSGVDSGRGTIVAFGELPDEVDEQAHFNAVSVIILKAVLPRIGHEKKV